MRFPLRPLFLVIDFQLFVVLDGHGGCLPQCQAQIGGAAFAHMRLGCLELSGLVHRGINARIGNQLSFTLKAVDIPDLGQNGRTGDEPNPGDGGNEL